MSSLYLFTTVSPSPVTFIKLAELSLFKQIKLNTNSRYFLLKKLIVISPRHFPNPGRCRRRFLKLDGKPDLPLLGAVASVNSDHHFPGLKLRMLSSLRDGKNRLNTGILTGKNLLPLGQGFRGNFFIQGGFEPLPMFGFLAQGVAFQVGNPQGVAQACGELGFQAADR